MASSFSLRCICSSRASISLLSSISAPSLSLLPSPLLFAPAPRRFFAPSEGPTHTARPKCPKTPRRAKPWPCQLKAQLKLGKGDESVFGGGRRGLAGEGLHDQRIGRTRSLKACISQLSEGKSPCSLCSALFQDGRRAKAVEGARQRD